MENFTTNQLGSPSGKTFNNTHTKSLSANDILHLEFVQLGRERHKITYKLLSLLPKIYKTGVYREKGFTSIYEYSFKLAGLSELLVKKALKLDEHLRNKPCLQKIIESQGIHKVALVAKIATPQTDSFFADKVENMSKSALVELSKEARGKMLKENRGGLWEVETDPQGEQNRREIAMKIELDEDMQFIFLKLKNKFGKNMSNKEVLRKILETMNEVENANKSSHKNQRPLSQAKKRQHFPGKISRYIPAAIKQVAIQKINEKCAHENCNKPYEILHHVKRFALNKNNELVHENIIPLCKEHHEFAHNGILENDGSNSKEKAIDEKYREYRRKFLMENDMTWKVW